MKKWRWHPIRYAIGPSIWLFLLIDYFRTYGCVRLTDTFSYACGAEGRNTMIEFFVVFVVLPPIGFALAKRYRRKFLKVRR